MKGVGGTFKARSRAMKIARAKQKRTKWRRSTIERLKESIQKDMIFLRRSI